MEGMIKIGMAGILAALAAIQFKNGKQEYAILISIGTCLMVLFFSVGKLQVIFEMLDKIRGFLPLDNEYIRILLKIIGITYVAEFSADLCKDAGHAAVGNQIEFAARLCIMAVSMPVLVALLDTIHSFTGNGY